MPRYDNPPRKRLNARAKKAMALAQGMPDNSPLLKCPSQKHSERLKKKLMRGEKTAANYIHDCFTCKDCDGYKAVPESEKHPSGSCHRAHRIYQCRSCGQSVMYAIDSRAEWKYCPRCRETRGVSI